MKWSKPPQNLEADASHLCKRFARHIGIDDVPPLEGFAYRCLQGHLDLMYHRKNDNDVRNMITQGFADEQTVMDIVLQRNAVTTHIFEATLPNQAKKQFRLMPLDMAKIMQYLVDGLPLILYGIELEESFTTNRQPSHEAGIHDGSGSDGDSEDIPAKQPKRHRAR
ncbi:MAG: hypothetical protein Q9160_008604 [Pyrenula sp. 1 TL-2023]